MQFSLRPIYESDEADW